MWDNGFQLSWLEGRIVKVEVRVDDLGIVVRYGRLLLWWMKELKKLHSFLAELGAQVPLSQFDEVLDCFEAEKEEPLDEVLGKTDTLQQ